MQSVSRLSFFNANVGGVSWNIGHVLSMNTDPITNHPVDCELVKIHPYFDLWININFMMLTLSVCVSGGDRPEFGQDGPPRHLGQDQEQVPRHLRHGRRPPRGHGKHLEQLLFRPAEKYFPTYRWLPITGSSARRRARGWPSPRWATSPAPSPRTRRRLPSPPSASPRNSRNLYYVWSRETKICIVIVEI